MWGTLFADGWQPIFRVLVIGTLSYIAVVALLRYFGKRALTKMNAFDIVVTVAVGSAFASSVTSGDGGRRSCRLRSASRPAAVLRGPIDSPWLVRQISESAAVTDRISRPNPLGRREEGATRHAGNPRRNPEQRHCRSRRCPRDGSRTDGTFSVIPLSAASNGKLPTALRDVEGVPEFQDENPKGDAPS